MSKAKTNGKATRHHRGIITYKSYVFKTKDPVIDELRTVVQDEFGGKLTRKALKAIEEAGGPTVSCMTAWFHGNTRRPTNAAVEAAGRAIGRKRVWVTHRPNK